MNLTDRIIELMWGKIKRAFSWTWKHPRLATVSITFAGINSFILPIMGITAFSTGIATASCIIVVPVLRSLLGWVGEKIGLIERVNASLQNAKLPLPHSAVFAPAASPSADNHRRSYNASAAFTDASTTAPLPHQDASSSLTSSREIGKKIRPPDPDKKLVGIERIPGALLQHGIALNYLDSKELTRMMCASRRLHKSLEPLTPVAKFLQHVFRGEQEKAEAMLIEEAKSKGEGKETKRSNFLSKLLTSRARGTDLSGRHFAPITAFQFALWAGDRHMWEMLLKYLRRDKALAQYKQHEQQGVSYQLGDKTIKEKHYNFSQLTTALKQYIDYMNNRRTHTFNWEGADRLWLRVGEAQRGVPAHVKDEYLRKDRPFYPTPTFDEQNLPRKRRTCPLSDWFSDFGLGTSFAVYRGSAPMPEKAEAAGLPRNDWVVVPWLRADLAALKALRRARRKEHGRLPELLKAQPPPTIDPPTFRDTDSRRTPP